MADLEGFKTNNPLNVEGCFNAMLDKWFFDSDDCYLDTFLGALRSEPVGLGNLCSEVENDILGNDTKKIKICSTYPCNNMCTIIMVYLNCSCQEITNVMPYR